MTEQLNNLPLRAINDFLAEIGAATSREQFLSSVLTALQRLVPFDVEGGIFQYGGDYLASVGSTVQRERDYIDYYQYRQPFRELDNKMPEDLFGVHSTQWAGKYRDTEMVTDFMMPGGIRKTLTSIPKDQYLIIALHRSMLAPDFTKLDRKIMAVVFPHVRNFYAIWERLGSQPRRIVSPEEIADQFSTLSRREVQILAHWCNGLTAAEIASRLFISMRTVETHIEHAYAKLDVHDKRTAIGKLTGGKKIALQSG